MATLKWATRIKRARATGSFTVDDMDKADMWTSCALGERFSIPTDYWSSEDVEATYGKRAVGLGFKFGYAVRSNQVAEAESLYNQIQNLPAV